MNTLRNRIARNIANFVLRHIATADYRDTLNGVIRVGMHTLDEEAADTGGNGPFGF